MDIEKCKLLIEMYKDHRSLWDQKDKEYYNKVTRDDSWRQISIALKLNVNEIKHKMKSLMGTYRREKSRQKQRTRSGKDSAYVTKWFAFDWFSFLSDRDNPNQIMDTLPEETEEHTINTDSQVDVEGNSQTEDAIEQAETKQNDSKKRRLDPVNTHSVQVRKKKRTASNSATKDPMQKAFELLQRSAESNNKNKADPYSVYGEHIANELRKYDPRTLAYVKQAINNIIFEADVGQLSIPSTGYFGHQDFQQNNFQLPSPDNSSATSSTFPPVPTPSP